MEHLEVRSLAEENFSSVEELPKAASDCLAELERVDQFYILVIFAPNGKTHNKKTSFMSRVFNWYVDLPLRRRRTCDFSDLRFTQIL